MARILIVDDESSMRLLIREMLRPLGHELLTAENGCSAAELLQTQAVDLIITDLVMPEKTGIDLILDIKKTAPAVKVLAISGGGGITGRFDYLPIAKLIGAEHILKKPFRREELCEMVTAMLAV
jgi:CheY-like chemotaxis protein